MKAAAHGACLGWTNACEEAGRPAALAAEGSRRPGPRHYVGAVVGAGRRGSSVTLAVGLTIFLNSSRTLVLATHDAELQPSLDGYVVLHTGPVLPDVRQPSGGRIGVDITLGKTDAASVDELLQRYAYIASQPEGQIAKVREALGDMVVSAALRGGARRAGAARRLVAGRQAAAQRAVPARPQAAALRGGPGARARGGAVVGALGGGRGDGRRGPGVEAARRVPRTRRAAARRGGRPPGTR